jgi:hypothetical protein
MFCDETSNVIRKARASRPCGVLQAERSLTLSISSLHSSIGDDTESKDRQKPVQSTPSYQYTDDRTIQNSFMLHLSRGIRPSIEDHANGFFFSEYVFGSLGTFEYLQHSYNLCIDDEHLSTCIRAVGLGGLSKSLHSSYIMERAMHAYASAVQSTRRSLQSSAATKDSTLLSVMLLDCFEALTESNEFQVRKGRPKTIHMNGAMELVKLRGSQQFQTYVGMRMFCQIVSQITVNCARSGIAIPAEILALRVAIKSRLNTAQRPTWHISGIVTKIVNFNAAISNGILNEPAEIIASASQFDNELAGLQEEMPSEFHFDALSFEDNPDLVYEGHCHIYKDFRIAQTWNLIRAHRVLINETIYANSQRCCSTIPEIDKHDSTLISCRSKAAIKQISTEICATVPQQAGYLAALKPAPLSSESKAYDEMSHAIPNTRKMSSGQGSGDSRGCIIADNVSYPPSQRQNNGLALKAAAYSLLWSLYIVGRCPLSDISLRSWVINRFKYIGHTFDISQATTLANLLEMREDKNVWSVFSMLGSYSRVPEDLKLR